MNRAGLVNQVRARRTRSGLSQTEVALRIGVSRQALAAIESGRHVPSTAVSLALARALRCAVEELFELPASSQLPATLVGAAPDRRVVLGRVDGAWRAHPLDADDRPADGLVVHGTRGQVEVEPLRALGECEHNVLIAGCAPLLGVLTGCMAARGEARGTWIRADSTRALDLLADAAVHVAGLHLADATDPDAHVALVHERFPDRDMVLVGLARWRQGIAVRRGNPLGVRTIDDTRRPDVRFVHRAEGSGAHRLLARLSKQAGITLRRGRGELEASGHAEVARLIRLGVADAGIAFEGAALDEGLDFVPLAEERFELVLPRARLHERPVAQALDLLGHRVFQTQATPLAGYDLAIAGDTRTVAG